MSKAHHKKVIKRFSQGRVQPGDPGYGMQNSNPSPDPLPEGGGDNFIATWIMIIFLLLGLVALLKTL